MKRCVGTIFGDGLPVVVGDTNDENASQEQCRCDDRTRRRNGSDDSMVVMDCVVLIWNESVSISSRIFVFLMALLP
jgi:hypothetical protein